MDKDDVVRFIEGIEEDRDGFLAEVKALEYRVEELEDTISEYEEILGDRRALLTHIGELP